MQEPPTITGYLTKRRAKRLQRSVAHFVLTIANSAELVRAGYDLALKKPQFVKRFDRQVVAAHERVKPALIEFVVELEDVLGCRMPWAYLGFRTREEAEATFRKPKRKGRPGKKMQANGHKKLGAGDAGLRLSPSVSERGS
jgi:hypothetical protein